MIVSPYQRHTGEAGLNTEGIIYTRLKHCGNSVKDVVLFDSQAQGKSNVSSDYDILIILDEDYTGRDENKILDLCYDIDLKYNILIDVHLLSQNELSGIRGKQPVFVNAIKSGFYT